MSNVEELKFLETRQKLKTKCRKRIQEENLHSFPVLKLFQETPDKEQRKLPFDKSYGSFFGPSQPCISQRVIQQTNNVSQVFSSKAPKATGISLKITFDRAAKVKRIKEARDYSFLFSDDAKAKESPVSENNNIGGLEQRKNQIASPEKGLSPVSDKIKSCASIPKKQPEAKKMSKTQSFLTKRQPEAKNKLKMQSLIGKQQPEAKKILNTQTLVAKKQEKIKTLQVQRPRKRPAYRVYESDDDEDYVTTETGEAFLEIRKMFRTDRFIGRDDRDMKMEAGFEDIMKEEKKSAKLARKEDQEQLRLIEAEERRKRLHKLEKKRRKLGEKNSH